jgi:hypothetical protein
VSGWKEFASYLSNVVIILHHFMLKQITQDPKLICERSIPPHIIQVIKKLLDSSTDIMRQKAKNEHF